MPTEYRITSLGKTAMLTVADSPEEAAYYTMAKMRGENLFISPDLFADFRVTAQKGGRLCRLTEIERDLLSAFFFDDCRLPQRRLMLSVAQKQLWIENREARKNAVPPVSFCLSERF